jgi:hypothetical protein
MPFLTLLAACAGIDLEDTAYENSDATSDSIPAVDVSFVEPENDSAHQLEDPKQVVYLPTEDRYCESEMILELVVPPSTNAVPKVYVGYYSDESGWYGDGGNLDGLNESDTLDVGSSLGVAVSLGGNIHSTSEAGIYELIYAPAQDGLIDSRAWSFDLFVTASDGDENGPIEPWSYRNASPSENCN